jgi:hypothetical protein
MFAFFSEETPQKYVAALETKNVVRIDNEGKGHCLLHSFFTACSLPDRVITVF